MIVQERLLTWTNVGSDQVLTSFNTTYEDWETTIITNADSYYGFVSCRWVAKTPALAERDHTICVKQLVEGKR